MRSIFMRSLVHDKHSVLYGIMLPSIFEKHKICSSHAKSIFNIISKNNKNFAMEPHSHI